MKILLLYPQYPDTFWSFKHVLKIISKKSAFPPLGLLTIAAMLPQLWEKKLIDLNVSSLKDEDIAWADYVFISAMIVQKESTNEIIKRCSNLNTKIVAGGPLFTTGYEEFEKVDHFILGEAEGLMPAFLEDLSTGCLDRVYSSDKFPDFNNTPVPLWDLIDLKHYVSMPVQYSRGCPFNCEFCDIVIMNGRVPRTKNIPQILNELDVLYEKGWRSSVFIVDDNFIGNKNKAKEMLPSLIQWMKKRNHPFTFITEASLNLAEDDELMGLMIEAGFDRVFIGIETPLEESLAECNKFQNKKLDISLSIKKIQNQGMEVLGGFIVGFDSDPPSIFEKQIDFIQKIGVPTAMVGILTALPKTKLYKRLGAEGRLLKSSSGNNTDGSLNFIPKMDADVLMNGYHKILQTIYSPKKYYERVITFLEEYKPIRRKSLDPAQIWPLMKAIWYLGITGTSKIYYWKLMAKGLFKYPRALPQAMILSVYGFHFRKMVEKANKQSAVPANLTD